MSAPLAYHITWTTYGTWLSGDPRGWVRSGEPGVRPPDVAVRSAAAARMVEPPVILSDDQRRVVEETIRAHAAYRGWTLHALNVRTNHVHLVVTAPATPRRGDEPAQGLVLPEAV